MIDSHSLRHSCTITPHQTRARRRNGYLSGIVNAAGVEVRCGYGLIDRSLQNETLGPRVRPGIGERKAVIAIIVQPADRRVVQRAYGAIQVLGSMKGEIKKKRLGSFLRPN